MENKKQTTKPNIVQKALEAKQEINTKGGTDNTVLTFDSITNELIISSSNISQNDDTKLVVDKIYKDGFF